MDPEDLYEWVGGSVEGPMPLVIMTDGWLDASETLVRVHETIAHQADLTPIARFDTDLLLDQRARRPMLTVIDGVTRGVEWPTLELSVGADANDAPFLALHGPEPDLCWRPFGKAVATIASSIGVTTTYTVGAYPAPMPHTRPVRISSTASEAEILVGREHRAGHIVLPVGVFAAIAEELEQFGTPTHSFWAQVPYYLASNAWPQATIAMLDAFQRMAGLQFDASQLKAQVDDAVAAVSAMMEESPSLHEVVVKLEERHDALQKLEEEQLPSGDEIEEELQQYLRKIDGE